MLHPTPRIVSLVPSVTETLTAWGITPVAVTRFCGRPELPSVGGTKDPDVDAIARIGPDLVVMETEENRIEDHDALRRDARLRVHALTIRSVDDVAPELDRLANVVGRRVVPVGRLEPVRPVTHTAAVPVWRRPWVLAGPSTYGGSLLARLGVGVVVPGDDPRYPAVDVADVRALEPDLVIVPTEPYPFTERHRAELEGLGGSVVFVDGQDLFWWGVRTAAALRRLGETLSDVGPGTAVT